MNDHHRLCCSQALGAMDPFDLDPNPQKDFPTWPQTCPVTMDLPEGHWAVSDLGYCHWSPSWLTDLHCQLGLDLLLITELSDGLVTLLMLPSPGWSCSPDLDTVRWSLAGKIPTLPVMSSPMAPGSLSLTEQPAPAAPWQLRSNCSIFCVNRSQDPILSWMMTADQTMIAESEIKHSRQENTAELSKAHAQFGLNGGSFKYLAWP